jgi:predicted metal-dependent hydrolase
MGSTFAEIDGRTVFLRRSRRAKRLRLQCDSEGVITLVIPWYAPILVARAFLRQHEDWVRRQKGSQGPKRHFHSGDTFYYFGEALSLVVKPVSLRRPVARLRNNELHISLWRGSDEISGKASVKTAIEKFYRKKAEEVIHDRLECFNEHYGFRFGRVTLRNQKTRWGSCSSAGNLNFNWRLIMAPIEVIDYVVVHELCHLKEMNHSRRFWDLIAETIPDFRAHRKWLKEHHSLLVL